jgi:hypothetical protein
MALLKTDLQDFQIPQTPGVIAEPTTGSAGEPHVAAALSEARQHSEGGVTECKAAGKDGPHRASGSITAHDSNNRVMKTTAVPLLVATLSSDGAPATPATLVCTPTSDSAPALLAATSVSSRSQLTPSLAHARRASSGPSRRGSAWVAIYEPFSCTFDSPHLQFHLYLCRSCYDFTGRAASAGVG